MYNTRKKVKRGEFLMKKLAVVALVLVAVFAVAGCGSTAKATGSSNYNSNPTHYK